MFDFFLNLINTYEGTQSKKTKKSMYIILFITTLWIFIYSLHEVRKKSFAIFIVKYFQQWFRLLCKELLWEEHQQSV